MELREKYFPKESVSFEETSHKKDQNNEGTNYTIAMNEMIKDFEELSKKKIKKKANSNIKILSDIEQLNVDVPMNREKFRNYYLRLLQ